MTEPQNRQSAYHENRTGVGTSDIDYDIEVAMRTYLTDDLGIGEGFARTRAQREGARDIPKAMIGRLQRHGQKVDGKKVLDLGAGLGAMSEELVLRGALTSAVEPGAAWAELAERRVARHKQNYDLRRAVGESLPFGDGTFDIVVSLQVLEHVQDPAKVISEASRVLAPNGVLLIACENYMSFWEGHYKIFWLPYFPKRIAKLYLRARRKPSKFLMESVTYVSFAGVLRMARSNGLIRLRDNELAEWLEQTGSRSLKSLTRLFGRRWVLGAVIASDRMARIFKPGIVEAFRKRAV